MLQINSETAHKMFIQLMERFDKIEKMLERQNKMKECLDGDTLQVYREKGLIPFARIKHKIFYKPEDIQRFIDSTYHSIKKKRL